MNEDDCSFLVADGRDRIGANGGKVDRAVAFFVDLANEDAKIQELYSKQRVEGHVRERAAYAHHITLDEVEPEGDLLDALVYAVDALFRIRQDDVGLLVVTGEHALEKCERAGAGGNKTEGAYDYGASILENEEYAALECILFGYGATRR